jgi:adenylate cyclase
MNISNSSNSEKPRSNFEIPQGRIVLTPAKSGKQPQITITVLAGIEQGQSYKITRPTTSIGRSSTCDIVLTDPLISRQHCQIILGMSGVHVKDLGSTNGTFINGAKISESPIRTQDIIAIGNTRLRFAVEVSTDKSDSKLSNINELAHKKLLTLYEVGNIVNSILELKTLLNIIMTMAIKVMQANRGFLLLQNEAGTLDPVSTHLISWNEAQAPYSKTIVETVLRERLPALVLDPIHDIRFSGRDSLKALPLSSIICVPIWEREKIIGVIYVDKVEGTSTFNEEDMYFLSAFANQAAIAISNAKLFDNARKEERLRTSLQRYLSPNIVEDFLKNPQSIKLGGGKKEISVLFCDIRGFTSLTEQQPVETIVKILNEYFSSMSEIIFSYSGTLDKFIGDAIMAIYGAPISMTDHAFRCIQTALKMRERIFELNSDWQKRFSIQIEIGIGINSGEAIVGNIGSERRMEYTAIGDVVNVASRLEGESQSNQILVSEKTWNLSKNNFNFNKLPIKTIRGKKEKIQIYEAISSLPIDQNS